MKKEEILEASRRENKNKDLAELEIMHCAGSHAGRVGALVCCVVSLLASQMAKIILYSPWAIYFSIMATNWIVRALKLRKKSDWVLATMFIVLTALAMAGFVKRLLEVAV